MKLKTTILSLACLLGLIFSTAIMPSGAAHAEVHLSGSKVVQGADSGNEAAQQKGSSPGLMIAAAIVISALVTTCYGVYLGLNDKAVFYSDGKDVIKAFIPLITPLIALAIVAIISNAILGKGYNENPVVRVAVALATSATLFASLGYVFMGAYAQNNGNSRVALVITVSKMCLSILCLGMFMQLMSWDKNKSAAQNWARRANAAMFLAFLTALMKKLINGERVEIRPALQPE